MKRASLLLLTAALAGCAGGDSPRMTKAAVFVGVDVSGSFRKPQLYDDSLDFMGYYLYGHLHGLGGLAPMKSLFVGAIGGAFEDEPQSFHPIQDFDGKGPEQISADMKNWFSKRDHISDFNVFFRQIAHIAQKRNLSLSHITVVMLTDGVPAVPGSDGESKIGRYEQIDMTPLEFLSRNVTARLLFADPLRSNKWETVVPHNRVRLWTADQQVMSGWRAQLVVGQPPEKQDKLWRWVADNVDFRVRSGIKIPLKSKAAR